MENFIEFTSGITKRQFQAILSTLSYKQKRYLREIVYNILHEGIELSDQDKAYLRPHRHFLRRFMRTGAKQLSNVNLFMYIVKLVHNHMSWNTSKK